MSRPRTGPIASLAVTGSKGGVGKTNLVTNVAVALARWGRRVLLVDGDLGLSNVDVLMGLVPTRNVEHLIRGEARLSDILIEGPAGVRVLPAASGLPELCRLDDDTRGRLLDALNETCDSIDDLLIDTGAGLGDTTLTLQLAASRVVLVTTPEPTSLVDAYATLKVLWAADPSKRIDVVVNDVEDDEEGEQAYQQLTRAAKHFLGQEPANLGAVHRDPLVSRSVRRQQPLLELYPDSPAARCYERIAMRLTMGADTVVSRESDDYFDRLLEREVGTVH